MGCDLLKLLIEKLPNGSLKNELIAVYNRHCGQAQPLSGGDGQNGPPGG